MGCGVIEYGEEENAVAGLLGSGVMYWDKKQDPSLDDNTNDTNDWIHTFPPTFPVFVCSNCRHQFRRTDNIVRSRQLGWQCSKCSSCQQRGKMPEKRQIDALGTWGCSRPRPPPCPCTE